MPPTSCSSPGKCQLSTPNHRVLRRPLRAPRARDPAFGDLPRWRGQTWPAHDCPAAWPASLIHHVVLSGETGCTPGGRQLPRELRPPLHHRTCCPEAGSAPRQPGQASTCWPGVWGAVRAHTLLDETPHSQTRGPGSLGRRTGHPQVTAAREMGATISSDKDGTAQGSEDSWPRRPARKGQGWARNQAGPQKQKKPGWEQARSPHMCPDIWPRRGQQPQGLGVIPVPSHLLLSLPLPRGPPPPVAPPQGSPHTQRGTENPCPSLSPWSPPLSLAPLRPTGLHMHYLPEPLLPQTCRCSTLGVSRITHCLLCKGAPTKASGGPLPCPSVAPTLGLVPLGPGPLRAAHMGDRSGRGELRAAVSPGEGCPGPRQGQG